MKKFSKTLLVLGSVALLSGCGMKTKFDNFKKAVGKIKASEYTKLVAKVGDAKYEGTLQETEIPFVGKIKLWTPNSLTDEKAAEAVAIANGNLEADDAKDMEERKVAEGEKITYFVNNLGYEYVDKDGNKTKMEWDKYGLVKLYEYDNKTDDSKDYKVSFSYSK